MQTTLTQAAAEQAIHDALEAGDERMLQAFADFAAGEIDDKHVAALLLTILQADNKWPFTLLGIRIRNPELADAIDKLENELERQRAHFIEAQACCSMRDEEARQLAAAELDRESRHGNR